MPDWSLLAWGTIGRLIRRRVSYVIPRGANWLSLVGPKLEIGTKIREAVTYESSPGCFEPVVTEAVVRLPGLLLERVV